MPPLWPFPLQVSLREATYGQEISRGCLSKEDRVLLCNDDDDGEQKGTFKVRCCHEDHCNDDVKKNERRIELRQVGASKLISQLKPGAP